MDDRILVPACAAVTDKLSSEAQREYRQNQAQEAAVAGAVVGGSRQRRDRREQAQSQQQQAQ